MVGEDLKGKTMTNSSIALITTIILHFVPGINLLGPFVGGFLGGYLQREGVSGGVKVGGLKGILMILPALPLALFIGALLRDIPVVGALAAGGTIILVLILVGHSLLFGIGGGIAAGIFLYMIDATDAEDRGSAVTQSNNIRQDTHQARSSDPSDGDIRTSKMADSASEGDDRRIR